MLRHAWPDTFGSAGIVGVVVFFALSGYLITGVLARDLSRFGHVQFYLVWPLVLAVGLRLKRLRLTVILLCSVTIAALAASLILVAPDYDTIYAWPTTWLWRW